MPKIELFSRIISIFLIVSILFTGCDVPDISKFSEASAEMTRGVRTSIKETENILKTSVEKRELFNNDNQAKLKKNLENYQKAMKPTLKVLDSMDSYLEALNALSQANKKSEENSKAVIGSVSDLVTAVSGIQLAGTAVNIVTGLVTLGEQFRTAKDFKKRVNLAADIVEGRYIEEVSYPIVDGQPKETKVIKKVCTDDMKPKIEAKSKALADTLKRIESNATYSVEDKKVLTASAKEQSDKEVFKLGCGITDFLKFTLQDLKNINEQSLKILYSNYREKNDTILDFRAGLVDNDLRVQKQLKHILEFKSLIATLRETNRGQKPPAENMKTTRNILDSIFFYDGQLKISIENYLKTCNVPKNPICGKMENFLTVDETNFETDIYSGLSIQQWETSVSNIESLLDSRAGILFEQNQKYLADLERITPSYTVVKNELKAIKDKQEQMDKLIDTNIEAVEAWREAHANLRIALNTKKPMTASRLTSKAKEIWAILNPEK